MTDVDLTQRSIFRAWNSVSGNNSSIMPIGLGGEPGDSSVNGDSPGDDGAGCCRATAWASAF